MEGAELIGRVPMFAALAEEDRRALAAALVRRTVDRGETVFRQGDPGGSLFIVEAGRVKITTLAPDGRETIIAVVGPGEVFGELSLLAQRRTADARAMEPTALLALSHDAVRSYLVAHPAAAWELVRALTRIVLRQDRIIQDMAALDVAGRVARQLLDFAADHGEPVGDAVRIGVPLLQEEIAQMVGASRESVNQALASFASRGWVAIEGRSYVLLDREALARRIR
jgi:CRP/FNR family cyclic AMP-dependent transcriptional regulator